MNCNDLDLSRTQEVWVQITDTVVPGIKPYYYVSNWGRIGSMMSGTFKIMSPATDQDGYLYANFQVYACITENNCIRTHLTRRVNRIVIMSFCPLPENYKELEVNHINSIRNDNHLWNLEWVTPKENVHHAMTYGNLDPPRGSDNPYSKLTENDVYKIVELAKTGKYMYKDLGKMFDVTPRVIRLILNRKSWTHLDLDITEEDLECFRGASFSNTEFDQICKFFESNDINNESIYPGPVAVVRDCFYTLGLDKKYNFESKKNSLIRVLRKNPPHQFKDEIDKYNYKFIR